MSRYLSALQDYSSPNTCGEQSRWSEAAFRWKNGTAFCDLSSESVKVQAVLHHFYHHAWHKDRSINVYCAATRTPYDTWQIKPLNIKYLTSSSGSSLSILNPNTNISRKERCKKQLQLPLEKKKCPLGSHLSSFRFDSWVDSEVCDTKENNN